MSENNNDIGDDLAELRNLTGLLVDSDQTFLGEENAVNIIFPYPLKHSKTWVFDDPSRGLVSEPFVFGSSEILTALTKWKLGMIGMEKFKLTFSKYPLPVNHARFVKMDKECGSGAWYKVNANNKYIYGAEGWLCPATLKYFRGYPDVIHIYVEEL